MKTVVFEIQTNSKVTPYKVTVENADSIEDAWHQVIDSNWVDIFYVEQIKVIDVS